MTSQFLVTFPLGASLIANSQEVLQFIKDLHNRILSERGTHGEWNPMPWITSLRLTTLGAVAIAQRFGQALGQDDLTEDDLVQQANALIQDEPSLRVFGLYRDPVAPPVPKVLSPLGAEFAPGKRYAASGDTRRVGQDYIDAMGVRWLKVGIRTDNPLFAHAWYERI